MSTELEYVPYSEFVAGLSTTENPTSADKTVISNETDGPRAVPGSAKDRSTTLTAFRSGDVIPVDGPSGTAKMSKEDLLRVTSENAVGISVAPNFDETINYKQMDIVSYEGNLYVFVGNHNAGPWNAGHVCRTMLNKQIKKGGITSCHIKGNNATLKTEICLVCEQSWIELDIDTSDWTINNDTNTSHILFSVKALSRNSAPRIIFEKTIGDGVASLPSKLVFDTKNGEQALYFVIRCDNTKYASFEIKDFTNEIVKGSVVDKSNFEQGNISISASTLTYSGSVSRVRTRAKSPIKMRAGDVIFCKTGFAFYIAYSSDGVNPYTTLGWTTQFIAPSDCYVHIVARKGPEVAAGVDDIIPSFYSSSSYSETNPSNKVIRFNEIVNAVNHRGYNTCAPENTLPAFKLSAKAGFRIVETDVRETADGELVCIHDASVDRTSNGSGDVADMTLAQLKSLDFGSWKNVLYTGTTIPTLQEFLVCCRNLGLKAYIEIKVNDIVDKLLSIVKGYGMENNVTYISPLAEQLEYLVSKSPKSRIGLVRETFGLEVVTWANNLKSFYGADNVFIDAAYINLTSNKIGYLKDAGIPLEVWTVEYTHILNADGYISGFTSNDANASILLYNQNIN